jgi:hypothetical protein
MFVGGDERVALLLRMASGAISPAKKPACAAAQRCWLRSAKASWSARLMPKSVATFRPSPAWSRCRTAPSSAD